MANRLLENTAIHDIRADGAMATYRRALRAHRLLVALAVAAAVAGHFAWRAVERPRYEATAQLLISPIPADDPSFVGLPVLRETSGDPARTIETAAALLVSEQAARRAARTLRPPSTARYVREVVELEPQGQSSVVAVTATAATPRRAAQIADAYAAATLSVRAEALRKAATDQISRLEAQLEAGGGASGASSAELTQRLNALRTLAGGGDPSLSLSQQARTPDDPAGPPSAIVLLLAALVGFVLGSLAAVLREVLAQAVRDEDEAMSLYPLPVLTRVPVLNRRDAQDMIGSPWRPPPDVREAFRTLLAQLPAPGLSRVVMLTSASAGDGKTTSAINLAVAIADSGDDVVLLDFDLRKPEVGAVLGLTNGVSQETAAQPGFAVGDALSPVPGVDRLSVLAMTSGDSGGTFVEPVRRRLPELIDEARGLATWVVVDTAPLGIVSDALGLLPDVDDIVVVARPGFTHRRSFETMRDLLERASEGRRPAGMVLITKRRVPRTSYGYGYGYGAVRDGTPSADEPAGRANRRRTELHLFLAAATDPR